MLEQHGNNLSHVVVGSSTHNQRIERLWRDVHCCVLRPFADQFYRLEEANLLDPLNEVDIFLLACMLSPMHYQMYPVISRSLE